MKFFNNPYIAIVAMIATIVIASVSSYKWGMAMQMQDDKKEYSKKVISGIRLENLRWLEMTKMGNKAPEHKEFLDHEELVFPSIIKDAGERHKKNK